MAFSAFFLFFRTFLRKFTKYVKKLLDTPAPMCVQLRRTIKKGGPTPDLIEKDENYETRNRFPQRLQEFPA